MRYSILIMIGTLTLLYSSLSTANSHINLIKQLTIVNHFDQPLIFKGRQDAHQVLPNLPAEFELSNDQTITTQVLDIGKHAYVRVDGSVNENAFFGVGVQGQDVVVHGYIGKNIAYSWTINTVSTLIFCTPATYKMHGHC